MKENRYDLISISHFFYPIKGGLENMSFSMLTYFTQKKYRCIAVHGGADKEGEYKRNGFQIKPFKTKNLFNNTYPIFGLRFAKYLHSLIKHNPDAKILIHARHVTSSFITSLVCKRLKRDYYLVEHTAETSFVKSKLAQALVAIYEKTLSKYVLKNAKAIICVSKASQDYIIETYHIPKTQIHIINNGIDTEELEELQKKKKENNVVFAAKFIKVKDPQTTYNAFKTLAKQYPNWNFYFIGSGDALKPQITQYRNFKIINSMIERSDLLELFAKSKIYINSSLSEAMSLTNLEATFLGNIPVLSDAPSNIEIAKRLDTTPFIFQRENQQELEEKIRLAIQYSQGDKNLNNISKLTKKHFNNSKLFKKYEEKIF